MLRPRVIPVVALSGRQMVKTVRFRDPKYLGDPVNALRLFNTKEVDELILLDIDASRAGRRPDLGLLRELAGECFMPVAYGGGIRSVADAGAVLAAGIEKVVVNSALIADPELATEIAREYGRQSLVGSIDVHRPRLGGPRVQAPDGSRPPVRDPVSWARRLAQAGAGELLVTAADRDGTASGYDLALVAGVAGAVDVPVVACGGAGSLEDLRAALGVGAAAAAAGRLFVTRGKHLAALVSYPVSAEIEDLGT